MQQINEWVMEARNRARRKALDDLDFKSVAALKKSIAKILEKDKGPGSSAPGI